MPPKDKPPKDKHEYPKTKKDKYRKKDKNKDFPPGINTPEKRLRWAERQWWLLHELHRAERAKYPEKMRGSGLRGWRKWEAAWRIKMKHASTYRLTEDVSGVDGAGDPLTDFLASDALKTGASTDVSQDGDIDIGAL